MRNPFECEGCKERRAKIAATVQEMIARFHNPNAVHFPAEPVVNPTPESESKDGK